MGPDDGGSYSCLPGNLPPPNITVHVLKGILDDLVVDDEDDDDDDDDDDNDDDDDDDGDHWCYCLLRSALISLITYAPVTEQSNI